jgi:RNA polymerase sigma-70 factor (ECF subfamily)
MAQLRATHHAEHRADESFVEHEILQRLHSTDERTVHEAFGRVVEQYQRRVYAVAYDLTGNHDDAQDLAQETFVKAFAGIRTFQGTAQLSTWLHRITVNTFIDATRSGNARYMRSSASSEEAARALEAEHSSTLTPVQFAHAQSLDSQIRRALTGLSPQQRAVFVLRHYHDEKIEDIAHELGVSDGTVKTQLFRAIQQLRTSLAHVAQEVLD